MQFNFSLSPKEWVKNKTVVRQVKFDGRHVTIYSTPFVATPNILKLKNCSVKVFDDVVGTVNKISYNRIKDIYSLTIGLTSNAICTPKELTELLNKELAFDIVEV